MKKNNSSLALLFLAALMMLPVSCVKKDGAQVSNDAKATPDPVIVEAKQPDPVQLPVRFQTPSYFAEDQQASELLGADTEEYELKVGANITSTRGPQPLWDIFKRLVNLKGMSVSWASDVDQNVLVDVDISADDGFYTAIDNMLRQVDYFHEVQGNTIIVKYRETQRFHIAIPYMKGTYDTAVGGNFLTDRDAATGTEGTVKVSSSDNEFDVWENIVLNLDKIIEAWQTEKTVPEETTSTDETTGATDATPEPVQQATRRVASSQTYYTVDKSIGLITVSAPRPLLEKIGYYLDTLKTELYRQVVIEAKIIEVFLQDNSKIGIDWSLILKDFDITGLAEFGTGGFLGQVYPWSAPENFKSTSGYPHDLRSPDPDDTTHYLGPYPDSFVSKISLGAKSFSIMLNALNEQGDATVLSNPKLTVMNGQPAVISVGKDVAYIKEVSSEVDGITGRVTYTAQTDSVVEGVAFGVMASIIDNDTVIMHLTPITTDLVGDEIEYREFAGGLQVGLPQVQIREMSTMIKVDNGEMLIIGGLIDSIEATTGDFAPGLGSIPVLRYLFGVEEKRMEKRELVILLTPRII